MTHPLKQLVIDQKAGKKMGMTSICSANAFVLRAAMENAVRYDEYVLIESTANQVNQFGGYTGMKPEDFVASARHIAVQCGLGADRLLLGGDHLGPLIWQDKCEKEAMENAGEMIRQYIHAGYTKIHIDTSMRLKDDRRDVGLPDETIARRGAMLCAVAEEAYARLRETDSEAMAPVYVIGSEVPIPGGTQEEEGDDIRITTAKDFESTVQAFKAEYERLHLSNAWDRVIAVVVQPGVEFGDAMIHDYDRQRAAELTRALGRYPGLVFEGHSTDYQSPEKLRAMVEDGIAILKVGPALTFALREALFSLELIEQELLSKTGVHLSNIKKVLETEMLKNPEFWQRHYHGRMDELQLKREFSLSDRSRYYLPTQALDAAIRRLMANLADIDIPLSLLSQYMPIQYTKVRRGVLPKDPENLTRDRVTNCIDEYAYACGRSAYLYTTSRPA